MLNTDAPAPAARPCAGYKKNQSHGAQYRLQPPYSQVFVVDVTEAFRRAAAGVGVLVPNLPVIGEIARCGVEGAERERDGAYILHLDGLPAGGFQNFKDGRGWVKWRFEGGARVFRTPEERRVISESIRRANIRRRLHNAARVEARRVGFRLFDLNVALTAAERRLIADPDDARAWLALAIYHKWNARFEHLHDALLGKSDVDKIAALEYLDGRGV